MKIVDIQRVGGTYGQKLTAAGIDTVQKLLERAGSKRGRAQLAADTGIPEKLLLDWVNHADLMRLKGVGSEYSDLLHAAGVDSCAELAHRRPDDLVMRMSDLAEQQQTVRRTPTEAEVLRWIDEAKTLPRVVSH